MDPNASGDNWWPPSEPSSYWRRRTFALAVGLAVLGLLAWACSGALGGVKPPTPSPAAVPPLAALPQATAGQTAAAGATPAATPTSTTAPRGHKPGMTRAGAAARARHRMSGDCPPGAVVITLHASQRTFYRRTRPRFTIETVNTGRPACAFDLGPRSLQLVIRSGGTRIWGSADCAHGTGPGAVHLARGVPLTTEVVWNRHRSRPGCRAVGASASPGEYVATVVSGTWHSRPAIFVLR
jgi:hypothetical protein